MAMPSGTSSSSSPASGSNAIFKDAMNTFSIFAADATPHESPTDHEITDTTAATSMPSPPLSSPMSRVPSSSASATSPTTTLQQSPHSSADNSTSPTTTLPVNSQRPNFDSSFIPENNNAIHMPSNHNSSDSDASMSKGEDSITSYPSTTTAAPVAATQVITNHSLMRKASTQRANKALGFLGSLNPMSGAKQRTSKSFKKETQLGSPSQASGASPVSASVSPSSTTATQNFNPSARATTSMAPMDVSNESSDPVGRASKDLQEHFQNRKSPDGLGDKNESKARSTNKKNYYPHLGQRLFMAIGLSSSASSKAKQQGRRGSLDVLFRRDTSSQHESSSDESRWQGRKSGGRDNTDRKGGLMSHFIWPRIVVGSDISMSKSAGFTAEAQGSSGVGTHAELTKPAVMSLVNNVQNGHLTSVPTPSPSVALSAMNGDVNIHSVHKTEQGNNVGNENDRKKKSEQRPQDLERGINSIGFSMMIPSVLKNRRGSTQMQPGEKKFQSASDIMESSSDVQPHHSQDDPERKDICNRLGLQEIHRHATISSEDPMESAIRQQYLATGRRHSMSPLSPPRSRLNQEILQSTTLSESSSSATSGASKIAQAMNAKSSSRLARLGRFKFPSISMASIHKNKFPAGVNAALPPHEPTSSNIRRSSLSVLMAKPTPELPVKNPVIHYSASASTFASVNTTAMTTLGETTPGSSSHSSISSSHNALDMSEGGNIKKSRQSLSGFMEEQAHHPHHSSTSISIIGTAPNLHPVMTAVMQKTSPGIKEISHHNTLPQNHRNGPKNVLGSEIFASSTSSPISSHGGGSGIGSTSDNVPVTGKGHALVHAPHGEGHDYGHGFGSGIRSGFLKRNSRRSVSASHISSSSIFGVDGTDSAAEENKPMIQQGRQSVVKHFRSEKDLHSAALLQSMMKDSLELRTDGASTRKSTDGNEGSVGQYLFGSELSRISFGGGDAKSKAIKMEGIAAESNRVGSDALASTGQTSGMVSASSKQLLAPYMTADSSASPTSSGSDPSTLAANSLISGATITQLPSLTSRDHKSSTKPVMTLSTEKPSNPSPPKPPLSPAAIANARMERKYQGPLGHYMSPSSPPAVAPLALGKPKFSIMSSSSPNHQSTFSSYMPNLPSFNHGLPGASSTITSALNQATAASKNSSSKSAIKSTAYPKPSSTATPRNPNIPHLEPRSAVADYTPIINYKRQRSMSLQDADLLTADQFIALMPDDLPPRRRFSSEETLPDNMWYMNLKHKNVPQPDPATTLRSLLDTLSIKCGLVIRHLYTVSDPAPKTSEATVSATTDEKVEKVTTATAETNSSEKLVGVAGSATGLTVEHSEGSDKRHSSDATPTEAFKPGNFVKQQPNAENNAIDLSKDLVESVTLLFDEMDHTMTRMVELLTKYISTEQFSKLFRELDEMCYLAQEALRVDKCNPPSAEAMELNQNRQSHDVQQKALEVPVHEQRHQFQQAKEQHPPTSPTTAYTLLRLSGDVEVSDTRQLSRKESKDCVKQRQNPHKHHYRYRPQGHKSEDAGNPKVLTREEQQDTVKDYIRTVLSMAEICVAEYMRVYNRMFVIPTAGYRIEGCNDLKKIERALRPENQHAINLPIALTVTGSPQQSLLSRASAVQATPFDKPHHTVAADAAKVSKVSPPTANISAEESPRAQLTSLVSSKVIAKFGGHTMTRVKSLPESKEEWADLQRRKETGGSTGERGAIPAGAPAAVGTGNSGGHTQAGAGTISNAEMSIMGEYSTEHMGHEAYYYRNWFLGKEHRTFVGQVEGLGTVIISIIKDMVVPVESRPIASGRSHTGPAASHPSASSVQVGTILTPSTCGVMNPESPVRPELVHSAHSFYPGRGGGLHLGGGGSAMSTPRSSSEAMRVVLSAATVVATGAGSVAEIRATTIAGSNASSPSPANTHLVPVTAIASPISTPNTPQPITHNSGISTSGTLGNHGSIAPRWQYRCILRQKDVDSLRITLPEPESGPLNNLTRRVGKPQWKTILQSIHPAITQQVASKLKKVETNPHFEKELAKFDETMLRFNYKFGVLLVLPGQTKEEEWFGNQMASSPRFEEFLESGALGQKVTLKGFERFSAGLDTRSGEAGEYSYHDTWGDGFEIMYHVSTLLPFNTGDRQQIQRKRHIGNDIVCIIFVDGDQPIVPNAIKSQFLHIFVVIHLISLPDGTKGYSVVIACDEQVPEFGPPLPDPAIFKTPQELRAFLLCKMINGENAAYKAPRLVRPHQRARSGMLENLVAKANSLAKDKDAEKKLSKQHKAVAATMPGYSATTISGLNTSVASQALTAPPTPSTAVIPCRAHHHHHHQHYHHSHAHHGCQHHIYHGHYNHRGMDGYFCCPMPPISPSTLMADESQNNAHGTGNYMAASSVSVPGLIAPWNSPAIVESETAATMSGGYRRNSNAHSNVPYASLRAAGVAARDQKEREATAIGTLGGGHAGTSIRQQQGYNLDRPEYVENLLSPDLSSLPSEALASVPTVPWGNDSSYYDQDCRGPCSCCCCCTDPVSCRSDCSSPPSTSNAMRTERCDISSHLRTGLQQVSSPAEIRAPVNRHSASEMGRSQRKASFEEVDNARIVGMSIHNNKGRSKSELDLLLTPIQANHYPRPHKQGHNRGSSEDQNIGSSATIAIPRTAASTATANATPVHSSMKGRAHNFLTTLVRRRASSNDTSGLGPTTHLSSKPSKLGYVTSPLGAWNSNNGRGGQHHDNCCQHHHHHNHHCSCHPQQQQIPHRQLLNTEPPPHSHHQEPTAPMTAQGQPMKFKEGYILRNRTPMQINTAIASPMLYSSHSYLRHSSQCQNVPPPSASPASTISSFSSSSPYSSGSFPSASLRSSTGDSSVFNGAGTAINTGVSSTGISPQPRWSFTSRDALKRNSFSADRRTSLEVLGSPGASPSAGPTMSPSITTLSSGIIPNPDHQSSGIMDTRDKKGWQCPEVPLAYTSSSLRPMNSRNSLGSGSIFESTSTSASAIVSSYAPGSAPVESMTSTSPMTKTDYLNCKTIVSSRASFPGLQQQQRCISASEGDIERHLPLERPVMQESCSMAVQENECILPSDTYTSIPSSVSANTTVEGTDAWCASKIDAFEDMNEKEGEDEEQMLSES